MPARRRALIVNDDPLLRASLRAALEPDLEVVAEVRDIAEAVALTSVDAVDVIVMGAPPPPPSGVAAIRAVVDHNPALVVVMLTGEGDGAGEPRTAGGRAYVRKSSEFAELAEILVGLGTLSLPAC